MLEAGGTAVGFEVGCGAEPGAAGLVVAGAGVPTLARDIGALMIVGGLGAVAEDSMTGPRGALEDTAVETEGREPAPEGPRG